MSVWVVVPLRCLYACLKLHVEMFAVYAQKAVYRIENTPFLSRSPYGRDPYHHSPTATNVSD